MLSELSQVKTVMEAKPRLLGQAYPDIHHLATAAWRPGYLYGLFASAIDITNRKGLQEMMYYQGTLQVVHQSPSISFTVFIVKRVMFTLTAHLKPLYSPQ